MDAPAPYTPEFKDSTDPLTDAEKTLMLPLSPVVKSGIIEAGLLETNCFDPANGFVVYMVKAKFFTVKDLLYAGGPKNIWTTSSVNGKPAVDHDFVEQFVAAGIALGYFKWSAGTVALHKSRVYGRVDMFYNETVRDNAVSKDKVDGGASDDPILPAASHNCAQEYQDTYGEQMEPDKLPSEAMLGKIHRGMISKSFPEIRLTSVCSQDTFTQQDVGNVGIEDGSLVSKKKEPKLKVGTPEKFLSSLWMLLLGIVFVGVAQPADPKDWKGAADIGVVGGKRRQFSRSGASFYYDFWAELAKQFANKDVSALLYLEITMRKKWKNLFAMGFSLECCMRTSVAEYSGVTFAKAALVKKREPPHRPGGPPPKSPKSPIAPSKPPAGPSSPATSAYERAKSMPGFDPNLRTARFTKDKKPICVGFNIRDGCKFTACKHEHVCDVKMPDGTACGQAHTRYDHV
jgi:hypothetical protein